MLRLLDAVSVSYIGSQNVKGSALSSPVPVLFSFSFITLTGFSFLGCAENVLNIIESHGAISLPWTRHIDNIYDALDYCETTLLAEIAIDMDKLGALSFAQKMNDGATGTTDNEDSAAVATHPHEFKVLKHRTLTLRMSKRFTVSEIFQIFFELSDQEKLLIDQYSSYYEEFDLQAGTLLFALMDDPDCFYIVLEVSHWLECSVIWRLALFFLLGRSANLSCR